MLKPPDANQGAVKQSTLADFSQRMVTALPPPIHGACFAVKDGFIGHPMVSPGAVIHRAFQLEIAVRSLERFTLVVLPTGLGKTIIAALVAADILNHSPGKVVFLAPTKPLAQQHMQSFGRLRACP